MSESPISVEAVEGALPLGGRDQNAERVTGRSVGGEDLDSDRTAVGGHEAENDAGVQAPAVLAHGNDAAEVAGEVAKASELVCGHVGLVSHSGDSTPQHPAANPVVVSLTRPQLHHLLEIIAMCDQMEWGKNRRAALQAKFRCALDAEPGCAECEDVAHLNEKPPIGGRYFCREHSP